MANNCIQRTRLLRFGFMPNGSRRRVAGAVRKSCISAQPTVTHLLACLLLRRERRDGIDGGGSAGGQQAAGQAND